MASAMRTARKVAVLAAALGGPLPAAQGQTASAPSSEVALIYDDQKLSDGERAALFALVADLVPLAAAAAACGPASEPERAAPSAAPAGALAAAAAASASPGRPFVIPPDEMPTQFKTSAGQTVLKESLALIRVPEARTAFSVSGAGLAAAVLDTGLRTSHVDFRGRVVAQHNWTPDNGAKEG